MLFVRDVDVIEVHECVSMRYFDMDERVFRACPPDATDQRINYAEQIIEGRLFRRSDGTEVVLALSKKVEDTLGIAFEVLTNMEKEIDSLAHNHSLTTNKLSRTMQELAKYKQMKFWQRLKFLFGAKPK